MNVLLETLAKVHKVDSKEIALLLGVTSTEYALLENGMQELTYEQVAQLTELLSAVSRQVQPQSPVTIYNIGQQSHSATNVTIYIEDWNTSQKPMKQNNSMKSQSTSTNQKQPIVVFTSQLLDKLNTLKKTVEEFSAEFPPKTYEQFIAERDCIIDLLKEVDKEAVKQ